MIYVTRRDLYSKHHQLLKMSENVALNKHRTQYFPSPKYSLDLLIPHQAFVIISRRAWCSCYLACLSTWAWGQVKDNQQDDVMFVGIRVVAMVGSKHSERSTGKVVRRQLNQSHCLLPTVAGALVDYIVCWLIIMRSTHAVFVEMDFCS